MILSLKRFYFNSIYVQQAANGSDQAQPPPYDAGQRFVSVNPQTAEVFIVPENQSELVTVKEDNG